MGKQEKGVIMNPIRYGESNYNSPYGKDGLQNKTASYKSSLNTEVEADSYNPKYKSKHKKETAGVLATIALMVGSAVLAYKGKVPIKKAIQAGAEKTGSIASAAKSKFPNISQAGSSLIEACKTPVNKIKNLLIKKK